jgi:hypothetical protein
MRSRSWFVFVPLLVLAALPRPALAAFHFMEVEQVIGGVSGDTTAQAIQLRMRFGGQNAVNGNARLVVRDAAGGNPVVLSTFPEPNPANFAACSRILVATTGFAARTTPSVGAGQRDSLMVAIPPSYLYAGSLTFEGVSGPVVYWRVTWGGAAYTGPQSVDVTNDADGTTSPAFAGPLPSKSGQSLAFTPACGTGSVSTAAQYAVTAAPAVFTNNGAAAFTVVPFFPPIPVLPETARLVLFIALGIAGATIAIARRRLS